MTHRTNFAKSAPKVFKALIGFDAAARAGLDPALVELVQIRTAQLNRCAYCLHIHTSDARKAGESEERLSLIAVWQEAASFFSEQERAALALTDAVTLISAAGVPDDVYARAMRPVRRGGAGAAARGDLRQQHVEPHRHHHGEGARHGRAGLIRETRKDHHPPAMVVLPLSSLSPREPADPLRRPVPRRHASGPPDR